MTKTEKKATLTPVLVSEIEIDFVNQTIALLCDSEFVAAYKVDSTAFNIHISDQTRFKDAPRVPVHDLSYYDRISGR